MSIHSIIGVSIIVIGGIIGMVLDSTWKNKNSVTFYSFGFIIGFFFEENNTLQCMKNKGRN